MHDLALVAESLLRRLGLSSGQAAVLNSGSESSPQLLVYVFDKQIQAGRCRLATWHGLPVEFIRMEEVQPYYGTSTAVTLFPIARRPSQARLHRGFTIRTCGSLRGGAGTTTSA